MTIYSRICALPDLERNRIFAFYERHLGSVHVREVLGECHFQAVEYCTSMSRQADYRKEFKECLLKVQYFYLEGDPTRQAIDLFLEKANHNEQYWRREFLDQFFDQELQQLIHILAHKQIYLNNMIGKVKQAHNFSYPDVQVELSQILNQLEDDLAFIIVQLEQTRFAGMFIDAYDGIFETELIKLINIFSLLLIELAGVYQKFHQQNFCKRLYDLIERLLQSSLIIRHPTNKNARACTQKMQLYKFVLKTNSNLKFQADFFAPILLKNVDGKIKCKVLLVNEGVANTLIQRPDSWTSKNQPETCATLSNASVDFKEDAEKGFYSAKFERLTASNVTRCERRITDIVTDSKVVFAFHCTFKYGFRDIEVRGFSQPVVFVVHVVQESSAHGTMSWHNALTKHSHSHHIAPHEAPYAEVAKILNDRFFYTTGRGLTLENLKHIRREPFVDDTGIVTAKAFLKDVLQEFARNHQKDSDIKESKEKKAPSFWDWFYECNKLTVSSFKENWKRGLIEGFIPKKMAERLLMNEPVGSFIIRFSQSMLGVVSFDNNYGLAPFFSSSEFRDKTLDRCILSHQSLTFLYPNRRTEDVFTSSPGPVATPTHPGYAKVSPTYIIPRANENGRSPGSQNGAYSNISQSPDPYALHSPAPSFPSPCSSSAYSSSTPYSQPTTQTVATGSATHSNIVNNNAYQQFIAPPPHPTIQQAAVQTSMAPSPVQQQSLHRPNQIQGINSTQNCLQQQANMFPQSPQQSSYQNLLSSPTQSVRSQGIPNSFQGVIPNGQTNNVLLQAASQAAAATNNNNQQFGANPFHNEDSMDFSTIGDQIPPFDLSFQNCFPNAGGVTPNAYSSAANAYSSPTYQTNFHHQSPSYN